jgi:hypothetical protein
MVLTFLEAKDAPQGTGLGLHPLDIYRKSQLKGPHEHLHRGVEMMTAGPAAPRRRRGMADWAADSVGHPRSYFKRDPAKPAVVPRSAWKLSEAGIRFRPSSTSCLDDIKFRQGRLHMPKVTVDDSTAYRFHNMMVFEAMHVGTRNDVTAYVLFVKDLVDSADDVRLLARKGILENDLADDDDAAVRLFNGLTMDVYKSGESKLCQVRKDVEHHYSSNRVRVFLYESWANLRSKYFSSPWTLLALLTAILLIVGDLVQAVYAVMAYEPNEGKPNVH